MPTPLKFRTALLRSARLMSEHVNALLLPHQLNYSLWQVMYVLEEQQKCTSIEIAQYLNVSKPAIAKRIHLLNQLKLIAHLPSLDKREKTLSLSPHGKTVFADCTQKIDTMEHNLLANFDASQLQHSLVLLEQLTQQLQISISGDEHA